jgi:hypothetical protein
MNQKVISDAAKRGSRVAGHVYELSLGLARRAGQTMKNVVAALRSRSR